jgi:prepilin-type N-terminal cleavage/methylation domain-containing protein
MTPVLSSRRDGFTLLELIVSMLLLSVVALTIGATTAKLAVSSARSSQTLAALDLADDRLRTIQSDPSYTALESRYNASENALVGFPGLTRTTVVTHVSNVLANNRVLDYKVATVSVAGVGLQQPVIRVVAVGAP